MTIIEIISAKSDRQFTRPCIAHIALFIHNDFIRWQRFTGGYKRQATYTLDVADIVATDWYFLPSVFAAPPMQTHA